MGYRDKKREKDWKKLWREKSKKYLWIAFGGKCTICGYDKEITAFDYHHIDPSIKTKEISIIIRDGCGWDRIVAEARKCTILCCRCHREVHSGITKLPID